MAKNSLREKANKLKQITKEAIEQITLDVCKRNENYAIELNWQQLEVGKDRLGNTLKPYTERYAKQKGRKLPNLRLTGDFWLAFTLDISNGFPIELTSTDEKTALLIKRYGENIFNLNQVNTAKFAKYVQPQIEAEIRKLLQL